MDRDQRRNLIIGITVGVVLIVPLATFSPWGMARLERLAVENVDKSWAPGLQLNCAWIYGMTLRRDEEREAYATFYSTFTTDPRRGYAKYMVAVCLDRDYRQSRRATVTAYNEFLDDFEDDPTFQTLPKWREYVNNAKEAVERLTAISY